jgi:hypothetical protein
MIRAGFALVLLGSFLPAAAQNAPAIDSAVYLSFFREAARHESAHAVSKVNGEPVDMVSPSIQEAMGITDGEAKAVLDEATACGNEITALEESARSLVFESRLRAANDEKPSDALAEKLRQFDARRVGIIMGHVDALKASLGAARLSAIEDYIRSHQTDGDFFPVVGPKKKL